MSLKPVWSCSSVFGQLMEATRLLHYIYKLVDVVHFVSAPEHKSCPLCTEALFALPLAPNTSCMFGSWMFTKAFWFAWLNMARQQGNRSDGVRAQAFRGMRLQRRWCVCCTRATSHAAWTKEGCEGCAEITHLTDLWRLGAVNITEHEATEGTKQSLSYLLTLVNAALSEAFPRVVLQYIFQCSLTFHSHTKG